MREVVPSTETDRDPNLYYSRAVYRVTFTVTFDAKTGSLVAEQEVEQTVSNAGYSDETPELQPVDPESGVAYATFTNTYRDPKVAVVGLNGVKNYTDTTGSNPIQDNMFTFRIEPDPESPAAVNGPKPDADPSKIGTTSDDRWYYDVTNTGYDFGFGNVTFDETYVPMGQTVSFSYTVRELFPEDASPGVPCQGMIYDTHTCGVTVIIKNNGGTLTASLEYSDHGDGSTHPPYFTFDNSYTAQPTTASLSATKELTGRDWTDSDSFTFDLKAITADAPMPDVTEGTATKETQTVTFGDITFAQAGTYQYEITERLPKGIQDDDPNADGFQHEGVTYDQTAHTATVSVEDNGKGNLVATVTYDDNDANTSAVITNSYNAGHAVVAFGGTKQLTGRDWQAGDVFGFTLAPGDGETQQAVDTRIVFMPADTTASVTWDSLAAGNGQYVFDFEPIRIYQPGTYTFAIKEVLPADDDPATDGVQSNGITYDAEERIVVVTVADEGKGKLEVNVTTSDSSLFTNAYTEPEPTAATAELAVTKHLEGRDWTDGDSFTFALAALTDGAPLPSSQQATATAQAQTASFGTMEFTSAGTYEYKISEVLPADDDAATAGVQQNGVTYDESTCTAVVTVTEEDGVLSAHVTYDSKDAQSAAFTNRYTTTGSGNPGGTPTDDKTTGSDQDTYDKKKLARTGDAAGGLLAAAALLAVAGGVTAGVAMARSRRRS